jgi:exodeoxyribonuclease VII small subunit
MAGRKKAEKQQPEITLFSEQVIERTTESLNIEETFTKLDTIIEQMESPGVTLEASLELYKQAVRLADGMKSKLSVIRDEIDRISETEDEK